MLSKVLSCQSIREKTKAFIWQSIKVLTKKGCLGEHLAVKMGKRERGTYEQCMYSKTMTQTKTKKSKKQKNKNKQTQAQTSKHLELEALAVHNCGA
jgi:hypothetical protein